MTHNQIDYAKHLEDVRHNQIVEKETNRQNVATLNETVRNNTTVNTETARRNVSVESETNRHNVQTEGIQQQQNVINQNHFARQDSVAAFNAEETQRHNIASERISSMQTANDAYYKHAQADAATRNAGTNSVNSLSNIQKNKWDYEVNKEKLKQGEMAVKSEKALNTAKTVKTYIDSAGSILDFANNVGNLAGSLVAQSKFKQMTLWSK